MTTYEFFIECKRHNVRLEVPVQGLFHAAKLFRLLDDHVAAGAGRIVEALPGHTHVTDLTADDVRILLEGIDRVGVGQPGDPWQGPPSPPRTAFARLPADAVFDAMYFEV